MEYTVEELAKRHSVRNFSGEPLRESDVRSLNAFITMMNTHEIGMHFKIVCNDTKPFDGFTASYGFFRNAANYVACVMDSDFADWMERAGYMAQKFVMKATSMGLGTCFVGGTYRESAVTVQMRAGWKMPFIVLVGYKSGERQSLVARIATKFIHRHKRIPRSFFKGTESELSEALSQFPYLGKILEALSLAPSSLNKQPVMLEVRNIEGEKRICACTDGSNPKNLIDLGIAKYNMAAVTDGYWDWGNGAPFNP